MLVVLSTVCSSMSWVILAALVVLGSYNWTPASGQTCSLSAAQFTLSTVIVSAENVDGSTPAARVTWNTTVPPQCVASVRVEFRTSRSGPAVATYTTTNTSQTEVIQTGLQCATNYYITVVVTRATSNGVHVTASSSSVQVFVGDIPTPRVRAEVTPDYTSIRVSWQWSRHGVLMCVDLVRVHYQPEGGSQMMYTVNNTTATSATLPNLQCNTEYTVWVHAYARGGQTGKGSVSRMVSLPARAPPTPTEVTAQFTNGSSVRVTWQWTSSGPAPNCFNTTTVTYRPEGGSGSSLQLSDPAATGTTLTSLQCNTNYTIAVVATAGEYRRESGARTVLSLQDIPTPVGVRAEVTADNTSIRVSWQWSRQGLPLCVDLVSVHYQPEGGSLMMYTVSSATATSATLPNLQCNIKYTIWVDATGRRTGKTSVTGMVSLPARAPPTPTEVTAQFTSISTVRVAWQWTSSGSAPNCFNTTTVTYRPEGGSESSLQLSDPAATETTLTSLQCNTNYIITVVATAGIHRRERTVFLPVQGPQNLSAAVLSPTSVHLTWVAPCHTQQYHIYYRGTCGPYVDEGRVDTSRQEYTLNELQVGTNYSFTVNQSGFSGGRVFSTGPVYARTLTAVPSEAPQILEVMYIQLTEVSLNWREVSCVLQNGPITGYVVRYYATCGADRDVQRSKSVVTTGSTVHGLTPNTEYAFQVAAVNVNGTGPFSESITLGAPLGVPQLLEGMFVQSTEVYLSWREVPCVQNGYIVRFYPTCGAGRNEQQSKSVVTTVVTINSLTPNTEYAFQVAVVNANVTGPFSEPITLGGAPRQVTVTAVNSTSVVFSWSEVQCFSGSGAVTHYLVQYQSSCCGGGSVQNVTTDGLVQVISGLTPNTVYTFRVAAVGAGQNIGPFSHPTNTSLPGYRASYTDGPFHNYTQTPHIFSEAPTQHTSAWAPVAGIALVAVLVLVTVAVVESVIIWHQRRSITRMKDQTQSVYSAVASVPPEKAKTAEIPLKECSAYGQVNQGGAEREEPHIYELP